MPSPLLSIVIIGKNEEKYIASSIQSVIACTEGMYADILYVDSISTDGTLEIACRYPIRVCQLRPEWRLTPAAGRYIGFHKTKGEFVFFLDGDTILLQGFFAEALSYFASDKSVAAIVGRRIELYYRDSVLVGQHDDYNRVSSFVTTRDVVPGGNAIFRRSALDAVGPHNPFLFSEEEAELGDRLRRANYTILAIPVDMVIHNTEPPEETRINWSRIKRNFHLGPGQLVRLGLRRELSAWLLLASAFAAPPLAWTALAVFCGIVSLALQSWLPISVWLCISAIIFIILSVRGGGVSKSYFLVIRRLVSGLSLIGGFALRPSNPRTYPKDAVNIK